MTIENLKSIQITYLDAQIPPPVPPVSTGEYAPGSLLMVDGYIAMTASGLGSIGSTYRMCRIPVEAKIKRVRVYTDAAPDSNSSQLLALDFNLAFSDDANDGTNTNNQGAIPTTAGAGAVTPVTTYSSPNILYGTITLSGNNAKIPLTELEFTGANFASTTLTNTQVVPGPLGWTNIPIWKLFTFVNAQGYEAQPSGFFDLLVYVKTAAATGHAANLYASIEYCV